ncbi:MAG: PAS domain S-box protein, partial [Magnetococcus sp. DMHC-1]
DQRLHDQQFYTRTLFESNIDALMTTDPFGTISDVNRQAEVLTGRTRTELIGAPFKNCFTDPEKAQVAIKLALCEKKVTNYELAASTWDMKATPVSCNAVTFYGRDRTLQGVFVAARDITESKRVDLALIEANAELRNAKLAAEKANGAKSDFLANMSHEIRTPINAVIGLAHLMSSMDMSSNQRDYVKKILVSSKTLLSIINDILDYSKIEAGMLELNFVPFRLDTVFHDLATIISAAGDTENIEILFSIDPSLPPVLVGDDLRLRQVLIN